MDKIQQYLNFLNNISAYEWRVVFNPRGVLVERKLSTGWNVYYRTILETTLEVLRDIIREEI
jgi:hypothetical protein